MKLSTSQIKQIAGRAGRYRTANQDHKEDSAETNVIDSQDSRVTSFKGSVKQSNVGLVTCLDEKDLYEIQTALNSEPDPIKAAGLQPPVEYIDAFANRLPPGTPFEYLIERMNNEALLHPRYFLCNIKDIKSIATCIGNVKGLTVVQNCVLAAAPADTRTDVGKKVIEALARCVADRTAVSIIDIPQMPLDILDQSPSGDRGYLLHLELLHKSLILYLWLSYRFTNIFLDREMAVHAKELVETRINTTLLEFSANPKLRSKLLLMRQVEHTKDTPDDSRNVSQEEVREGVEPGPAEEHLTESLNDLLAAHPVNWENRPSGDELNPDAESLDIRQPAAARA